MPEDFTRRPGRTDEVGRSPEQVEHDFEHDPPAVQRSEHLKNAERYPRLGNEQNKRSENDEDGRYNDALGG